MKWLAPFFALSFLACDDPWVVWEMEVEKVEVHLKCNNSSSVPLPTSKCESSDAILSIPLFSSCVSLDSRGRAFQDLGEEKEPVLDGFAMDGLTVGLAQVGVYYPPCDCCSDPTPELAYKYTFTGWSEREVRSEVHYIGDSHTVVGSYSFLLPVKPRAVWMQPDGLIFVLHHGRLLWSHVSWAEPGSVLPLALVPLNRRIVEASILSPLPVLSLSDGSIMVVGGRAVEQRLVLYSIPPEEADGITLDHGIYFLVKKGYLQGTLIVGEGEDQCTAEVSPP